MPYDPSIHTDCLNCGATFRAYQSSLRKGGGKFCSRDCKDTFQRGPRTDFERRFWSKVLMGGPDACWEWTAACDDFGYGEIGRSGESRPMRAHVAAYELANGAIPKGLMVRHTCDNPPCCNPSHLILGTHADNMADAVERGRTARGARHGTKTKPEAYARLRDPRPREQGERNPSAILTDAQAAEIIATHAPYAVTHKMLADRFGVSIAAVARIIAGKSFKHLPR